MQNKKQEKNLAFIDGQNMYLGTRSDEPAWDVDFLELRKYLKKKYKVSKAYYFLGYMIEENDGLYDKIQEAGFVLKFRKHTQTMESKKKGNVDSDIVFAIMKKLYRREAFDKVLLVSGDGDYKMLVDFLIEENRFAKILFPNKKYASSLYKKITRKYFDYLASVKHKIEFKQKKGGL